MEGKTPVLLGLLFGLCESLPSPARTIEKARQIENNRCLAS
jgi:hypothetical protein